MVGLADVQIDPDPDLAHPLPSGCRRRRAGRLRIPPAPALPAAAVDRLPLAELGIPELDEDPYWRLVGAFLGHCRRAQTRRAYFTDLKTWYVWCVAARAGIRCRRAATTSRWGPASSQSKPSL
jgi:hypothetical protein